MENEATKPTQREQAAKAGGFSTAFGIIGFLFIVVPILSLVAVAFAVSSIRASRRIDAPVPWTSLFGLFLGVTQLCFAAWLHWILLTGRFPIH